MGHHRKRSAGHASRIGSRLFVDPVDWYKRPAAAPLLPRLAQAVWDEKRISIDYEGWAASGKRALEPAELRERLRQVAEQIAALNAPAG
ncbi:hypothetical protein FAZ69_17385 [Trinickia terrae]|uniref:Uncharacterized protein n=1 Tax=Trinickia terrae TaxID=2571161 RepID=A0A4U1I462_9BURK|nr:hypothetical protein [Trinickia terrae]TKC88025.1 hypothetical protein FAZ69_17385 [Trinickia terrae]